MLLQMLPCTQKVANIDHYLKIYTFPVGIDPGPFLYANSLCLVLRISAWQERVSRVVDVANIYTAVHEEVSLDPPERTNTMLPTFTPQCMKGVIRSTRAHKHNVANIYAIGCRRI